MAITLYIAKRGLWSSLSRWALEAYLNCDIGRAFLLNSKMAKLGYEVVKVMLRGSLINTVAKVCAWEKQDIAETQRGINVLILLGASF